MIKSASQLKGKIKKLAKGDVRKAETYIRLYFMERLLERISISKYKDRFVIKGGILAYDVYMITTNLEFSWDTLAEAFEATCQKRDTMFSAEKVDAIIKLITEDNTLKGNWDRFRNKNAFAKELEWEIVNTQTADSIEKVFSMTL